MSKVLVIGGSGSLGKVITNRVSERHEVTGTYCHTYPSKMDSKLKFEKLDVTNTEEFGKLDRDFDTVVLVSGMMPANMSGYEPKLYIDVNISGVLNVLEFCRENSIKKLIYVMTFSDVAAAFYSGIPIKENQGRSLNMTGDHAVYGISKATACDLIEHYHQEYDMQTIIFRIPTVYCADDNLNYYVDGVKKTKAYVKMIRSVVQNKSIEIWGNPNNSKDMPYVDDFARLVGLALENDNAQGLYNAGTGLPVSLEQFVNSVISVFGDGQYIHKIYRPEMPSQPNFTFDMTKTEKTFNFKPKFDIEHILLEMKKQLPEDLWLDKSI